MKENVSRQDDSLQLDQVFLGIAIGVVIASMIISVITYFSVQEIRTTTEETLQVVQQKLLELEEDQSNEIVFPE